MKSEEYHVSYSIYHIFNKHKSFIIKVWNSLFMVDGDPRVLLCVEAQKQTDIFNGFNRRNARAYKLYPDCTVSQSICQLHECLGSMNLHSQ